MSFRDNAARWRRWVISSREERSAMTTESWSPIMEAVGAAVWVLRRLSIFEHAKHYFYDPFPRTGLGAPQRFTDTVMFVRLGVVGGLSALTTVESARWLVVSLAVYLLIEALQSSFFHQLWRWQTVAAKECPQQFVYSSVRTFILAMLTFFEVVWLYALIYARGLSTVIVQGDGDFLVGAVEPAYFSVVVATTLGFGDFTPRTDVARAAVASEALVGLFMLAVVIARALAILEPIQSLQASKKAGDQDAQ